MSAPLPDKVRQRREMWEKRMERLRGSRGGARRPGVPGGVGILSNRRILLVMVIVVGALYYFVWNKQGDQQPIVQDTTVELAYKGYKRLEPAYAGRKDIQKLLLNANELTTVDTTLMSLTGLRYLELSDNKLAELPEGINAWQQLQVLHLSGNRLTELPQSMASLKKLYHLNLSYNLLRSLPPVLDRMSGLRELNLIGNPLPATEVEAWQKAHPNVKVLWQPPTAPDTAGTAGAVPATAVAPAASH